MLDPNVLALMRLQRQRNIDRLRKNERYLRRWGWFDRIFAGSQARDATENLKAVDHELDEWIGPRP